MVDGSVSRGMPARVCGCWQRGVIGDKVAGVRLCVLRLLTLEFLLLFEEVEFELCLEGGC